VDDPLHDVGVAAGRNRLEEIASHSCAPVCDPSRFEFRPCTRDYFLSVEQDAKRPRIGFKDRRN